MKRSSRWSGLFLLVLFCLAWRAEAQEFKTAYPGTGVVTLKGDWRFHTGDDLAWRDPSLNDSAWETITADSPWGSQTHPGYTGFAWYRRAIEIDGVKGPLSIVLPPVTDAYELYWNGEKIGGNGQLPPHALWHNRAFANVFALPKADATGTLKGVLSIRVWKAMLASLDADDGGGLSGPPQIGDSKVMANGIAFADVKLERGRLIATVQDIFLLVIGCFSLGLWILDRSRKLNLWLGMFMVCSAGTILGSFPAADRAISFGWYQFYIQMYDAGIDVGIWFLVLTLFGLDQERFWRRLTTTFAVVYLVSDLADVVTLDFWSSGRPMLQVIDGVTTAIYSVVPLYLFVLLVPALRRRRELSLLPMVLSCVALETYNLITGVLGQGKRFTHIDFPALVANAAIHLGPYGITLKTQLGLVVLIVMVWTVVRQQALEQRQQSALRAEVKSAREVQQVLVPEAMEPVAGFAISSLYWPADEVGGDLFQVLPGNEGDVLIVLADVSGKGLKAAMTVSLMVGALRTIAEYTMHPAEVLRALNRRLMGRTDGGFATCLVLHVTAAGEVSLANGGHLPPYFNGEEMSVPGSLPLGVSYDASFDEMRFQLHEEDEVTLYTDGVLEAQDANGNLYGFERTAELMRAKPSARAIAEAAMRFGQKDDITVVKLVRVHAEDKRERMSVDLQTLDIKDGDIARSKPELAAV